MAVEYCVISIGTLSQNPLWGEAAASRTAHATTTLVSEGDRHILVDPSLPASLLAARLNERTGKRLSDVTDVFCTTLRLAHRRGVEALAEARWWTCEQELECSRDGLTGSLESAGRLGVADEGDVEAELELLGRFHAAPEKFSEQIHLYPLSGPTSGSTGLLLTPATSTIVIAGDAALTSEHVRRGRVWRGCADTTAALESLRDVLELADIIVPGHDNLMLSPGRWL